MADKVKYSKYFITRMRLLIKQLFFPGLNITLRKRRKFAKYFLHGDIATLDAGCGNGAFTFLAFKKGNSVLAISNNIDEINKCTAFRDFLGINPLRCCFKHHNIYDILSLQKKFDQIICFEVLEHLYRDAEVLTNFAMVARPGAILHISTPFLHREPYLGERLSTEEDGGHLRLGYTHDELRIMLERAGFEVIKTDSAAGFFSQKMANLMSGLQSCKIIPEPLRIGIAIFFLPLYLLTLADAFIPYQPRIIYVQARLK